MNGKCATLVIVLSGLVSMAAGPASGPAAPRDSEADLAELVRDWDSYGLPVLPADAELSILEKGDFTNQPSLVYVIPSDGKSEGRVVSGIGEPVNLAPADKTTAVAKDAETLPWKIEKRVRLSGPREPNEELVLAVTCVREGRSALARQLLAVGLEAEQWGFGRGFHIQDESLTTRGAVAKLAWRYWTRQLGKPGADGLAIVERLEMLTKTPYGLDKSQNLTLIKNLRSTFDKSMATSGSYEAGK